jgi:hypothetical protein
MATGVKFRARRRKQATQRGFMQVPVRRVLFVSFRWFAGLAIGVTEARLLERQEKGPGRKRKMQQGRRRQHTERS